MCLDSVTQEMPGTSTVIESGWKVFTKVGTRPLKLAFANFTWNGETKAPFDKWIEAEHNRFQGSVTYEVGFHIFTDEKKLRSLYRDGVIRRVYYRRLTAKGIDQGIETVVAQEIYVPKNEDDWPPKG